MFKSFYSAFERNENRSVFITDACVYRHEHLTFTHALLILPAPERRSNPLLQTYH